MINRRQVAEAQPVGGGNDRRPTLDASVLCADISEGLMGVYGHLVGLDIISKTVLAVIKESRGGEVDPRQDLLTEECVRRLDRL